MKVSEVMTNELIVVNYSHSIHQIEQFFIEYHVNHIPVVFQEELVGIISTIDLVKFYSANYKNQESIESRFAIREIMTPNPVVVNADDDIKVAMQILSEGKFQSLVVVDGKKPIGIITNKDIVRLANANL